LQSILEGISTDRNSYVIRALDSLDVLQLCLLKTEPFDCDAALIKDVRIGQKLPCKDRPKLLSSLVEALASLRQPYWLIIAQERALKDIKIFRGIGNSIDTDFKLLSGDSIAPQFDLTQGDERMAECIGTRILDDYTAIAHRSAPNQSKQVERELTMKMWNSFEHYAPRGYCKEAVYHAMASILFHFKIENGNRTAIAQKICKRLYRQCLQRASA
jgi:hypothetical protein